MAAVTCDWTTRTHLVKVLRGIQPRSPRGRRWTTTHLAPTIDGLVQRGLLESRGRLRCPSAVREAIVDRLARARRLRLVADAVAERHPEDSDIRELFLAMKLGRIDDAVQRWFADGSRTLLSILLLDPIDPARLRALPARIAELLLDEVFNRDRFHRDDAHCVALYTLLRDYAQPSATLQARWAEELFWRGELDECRAVLDGLTAPRAAAVRGWLALVDGNSALAVQHLATVGEREELDELVYGLALVASGDARDCDLARGSTTGLDRLIDALEGTLQELRYWSSNQEVAMDSFVEGMALALAGQPLAARVRGALAELFARAEHSSHTWLEDEITELIAYADESEVESTRTTRALVHVVRPLPPWRKQLDRLLQVRIPNASAQEDPEDTGADRRLAWFIESSRHGGRLDLAPREQKRNRRGWTKGRPIALKRLYDESGAFDYLTPHDQEILAHLERDVSYGGYRDRYLDEYHYFDDAAWVALVGHRNVRWLDAPNDLVQVTLAEPVLRVEAQGEDQLVQLHPSSTAPIAVRRTGADTVEVVRLTEVHRRVGAALGGPMWIPRSEAESLRTGLQRLAPHLTVHSELGGWEARENPATPRSS